MPAPSFAAMLHKIVGPDKGRGGDFPPRQQSFCTFSTLVRPPPSPFPPSHFFTPFLLTSLAGGGITFLTLEVEVPHVPFPLHRCPHFRSLRAICFRFTPSHEGQQTATPTTQSSSQALTLLQQSLAALTGGKSLTDVTLSGTVRRIAGSDDESGGVTVKALAGTGVRLDLSLSSRLRSELRNTSGSEPVGSWSGPDGVSHAMSNHNLFTDPGWFPAFTISSTLSAPNAVITYVGPETHNGQSVIHVIAAQQFPRLAGNGAALLQHLTQTEIFLDHNTNLPVVLAFNAHPDNDAGLDLPVEIRFSDYRNVSGSQIPFHVQKFLNNSLLLDLQFQSASVNSGLSATSFNVQ